LRLPSGALHEKFVVCLPSLGGLGVLIRRALCFFKPW
jgi:hypothetical protein